MKLINLTSHDINIVTPYGFKTIKTSGVVARCNYKIEQVDEVLGVPVVEIKYGEIVGLPDPEPETYYIVSSIVKNAVGLSRRDVVTLYDVKRKNGVPYACGGFRING